MTTEAPLRIGFDLPFAEAIKAATIRGAVLPETYYNDLQGISRQLAFSIAGIAAYDQLTAVRDSLAQAMATGQSFRAWKDGAAAQNLGLPDYRLENIWRTNLQGNYERGRAESILRHVDVMPYLMYSAIHDTRTRPSHAAMDGTIRRWDDPWWKTHSPPCGYNSILPDQRVSGNTVVALKARYSGPAVKVVTSSGGRITVTAQHPVLTDRGWVFAKNIHKGDNLVCYGWPIASRSIPTHLNKNYFPPTIEQVFETLGRSGSSSVPRTAMNLYGDVEFINGDIEVVASDSSLQRDIEAECSKFVSEFHFSLTNNRKPLLSCLSPFVQVFYSAGFLGSFGSFLSKLGNSILSVFFKPFLLGSQQYAIFSQESTNPLFVNSKLFGDVLRCHSRPVRCNDAFWNWLSKIRSRSPDELSSTKLSGFRHGPFNSGVTDVFIGGFGVNANALGDIRDRHPGLVKFDDVTDVTVFHYSGHVYDLETKSGYILSHGGVCDNHYVVSNCRCSTVQLSERQALRRSQPGADGQPRGLNKQPTLPDGTPAQADPGFDYHPYEDRWQPIRQSLANRAAAPNASTVLGEALAGAIEGSLSALYSAWVADRGVEEAKAMWEKYFKGQELPQ